MSFHQRCHIKDKDIFFVNETALEKMFVFPENGHIYFLNISEKVQQQGGEHGKNHVRKRQRNPLHKCNAKRRCEPTKTAIPQPFQPHKQRHRHFRLETMLLVLKPHTWQPFPRI